MQGMQWTLQGNWAHFKKPETNNNPLTYDIIPKTAVIGLIGAVLGIRRNEMKPLFPQLSEDLMYGVEIQGGISKVSCGFSARRAIDPLHLYSKGQHRPRKSFELLKNPRYLVALALANKRSQKIWDGFLHALQNNISHFTPVLGLHNCPANIEFVNATEFSKNSGKFTAKCFVSRQHQLQVTENIGRIGFALMPTFQNDDFYNPRDRYIEVIYPCEGKAIHVEGVYYESTQGDAWWLV